LTLELLRISCAAPDRNRHHDGQPLTKKRTRRNGLRDDGAGEEMVVDQEKRQEKLMGIDGGRAGWWV